MSVLIICIKSLSKISILTNKESNFSKPQRSIKFLFLESLSSNKKTNPGLKIICLNRKASFNYFFEDLLEAGIVLKGSEIKSIRDGKVNIADAYAVEKKGEIVLINSHISPYKQASYSNHNPTDERKLLLNKREINKLIGKMQRDGFTIVPTKMYFKKGKAKIELAVAKVKNNTIKELLKKIETGTVKNQDISEDLAKTVYLIFHL